MGSVLPIRSDVIDYLTSSSAGAADGSTVIASAAGQVNDYFKGAIIQILASSDTTLVGERREVTSYAAATGSFLVGIPFTSMVPTPTVFIVMGGSPSGSGSNTTSFTGIADAGSTASIIRDAALTQADNYWNGQTVVMLSGVNVGLIRTVDDFLAATDDLVFANPFPAVVAAGDVYAIMSFNHLAAAADDTSGTTVEQVIGNKADAAVALIGTTASIVAYLKGIISLLGGGGGAFVDASVGPSNFFAAPVSVLSLTPVDVSYLDAVYLDVNGFTSGATLTAIVSVKVGAGALARTVRQQFIKDANNTLWAIIDSPTPVRGVAAAISITVASDNAGDAAVTVPTSYLMR